MDILLELANLLARAFVKLSVKNREQWDFGGVIVIVSRDPVKLEQEEEHMMGVAV